MSKPKGFSLIELMVTVAIIAILTGVGALGYSKIRRTARDAQRQMVMKDLSTSLEMYRIAHYGLIPKVKAIWQNNFDELISGGFIKANSVELEPLTGRDLRYSYTYCAGDNKHKYLLLAFLEGEAESQGVSGNIVSYQAGECANQARIIDSSIFAGWQSEMVCGTTLSNGLHVYCLGAL